MDRTVTARPWAAGLESKAAAHSGSEKLALATSHASASNRPLQHRPGALAVLRAQRLEQDVVVVPIAGLEPRSRPPEALQIAKDGAQRLTGICFCGACGGPMTLRTGKHNRHRCCTCSMAARQGKRGCDEVGATITPDVLRRFAQAAKRKLRSGDGTFQRDHLRALAQRVDLIDGREVRITGSKSALLSTLAVAVDTDPAAPAAQPRVASGRAPVVLGEAAVHQDDETTVFLEGLRLMIIRPAYAGSHRDLGRMLPTSPADPDRQLTR